MDFATQYSPEHGTTLPNRLTTIDGQLRQLPVLGVGLHLLPLGAFDSVILEWNSIQNECKANLLGNTLDIEVSQLVAHFVRYDI
jgi:hypothetical protein